MTYQEHLDHFRGLVQRHDLTYAFSDDHSYWSRGHRTERELRAYAKEHLKFKDAKEIWDESVNKKLIEGARENFYWTPSSLETGYVSMRNEDGTQWWTQYGWGDYRERIKVSHVEFLERERTAKDTRKNDNPDNGFLGVYNIKFHCVYPADEE